MNEWDSNKVKSLSVDMILKSLKHNLKMNAIHVFPRNIWMNRSSGNSVNNFYEKSSQPSGTIWKPEVGIFVCNRKKCKRYVLWSRTRQINFTVPYYIRSISAYLICYSYMCFSINWKKLQIKSAEKYKMFKNLSPLTALASQLNCSLFSKCSELI